MGLENGIILEHKNRISEREIKNSNCIELILSNEKTQDNTYETVIDYWCRDWNLRNKIILLFTDDLYPDIYEFELTSKDIDKIIRIIKTPTYFESCETVWDWYHRFRRFKNTIKSLKWVKNYMKKNPENVIRVYFYDSF